MVSAFPQRNLSGRKACVIHVRGRPELSSFSQEYARGGGQRPLYAC